MSTRIPHCLCSSPLPTLACSIVTVWVLLTCLFTGIIFAVFISSTLLWTSTIVAAVVAAISLLVNRLSIALFSWCVARGNKVRHARLLLLLDLIYTATFGAFAGLTSGIARFVLGVVWLMLKMTLLSRPIVPNAVASWDAGFVAYGGMMKSAFAWRLDHGSSPTEPEPDSQ